MWEIDPILLNWCVCRKKQAVGSLVDVIKICRKAFDDPENLDEFEIMDKLAALFAHIENIKVCRV